MLLKVGRTGADIAKNPRGARFQMGHTYHTILFKAPEAHLEISSL